LADGPVSTNHEVLTADCTLDSDQGHPDCAPPDPGPSTPPGGSTPPASTPPGGSTPPASTPPGGSTPPGSTPPGDKPQDSSPSVPPGVMAPGATPTGGTQTGDGTLDYANQPSVPTGSAQSTGAAEQAQVKGTAGSAQAKGPGGAALSATGASTVGPLAAGLLALLLGAVLARWARRHHLAAFRRH
jgi:hypothetical protein